MFSLTSFLSFFKPRTRMLAELDPAVILFDPNIVLKPGLFLYTFTSWASLPPSGTNPDDILSKFKVQEIYHNKIPHSPEHKFLIIVAVDGLGQMKRFILDRMVATQMQGNFTLDPVAEPEAHSRKILERIKSFVSALAILVLMPSESYIQQGSSSSSPGPASDPLSIADKSTLLLMETASLVSDSLDIQDNSPAFDRFLGENFIHMPRWQGETVRCLKPNNLTLFELVLLSHAAHELYPTYSLLKEQCYFYAGIIFAAVEEHWDASSSDDLHLTNFGRWNGLKVQRVESHVVSRLISKYQEIHTDVIAKIMEMANARRDQKHWAKVKTIIDGADKA